MRTDNANMELISPQELFEALMAGDSAEQLHPHVENLPFEERDLLLAALYSVREEVAATCRERAEEIDRLIDLSVRVSAPRRRWSAQSRSSTTVGLSR